MLETVIMPLVLLVIAPLCGIAVFRRMAKIKRVRRNVRTFRC